MMALRSGRSMLTSASPGRGDRSELPGHRQECQILQHLRWGARLRARRAAPVAALNDQRNLAALTMLSSLTRAREAGRRDAIVGKQGDRQTNRPCSSFSTKSPIPTGVYASAIGLCKNSIIMRSRKPSNSDLTVFQHVDDPTRVRTVADKNSAVTPFDLRPTVADQVFKGNSIEVRGQFNCAMNMPSTGCATLP